MGGWRPPPPPPPFTLMPKLLLVPMLFLGLSNFTPNNALTKTLATPLAKPLASSDAAAACAEDLMALFSGPLRSQTLSNARAAELRACVRPLVPYHEIGRRKLRDGEVEDLEAVNAWLVRGSGNGNGDFDEGVREKVDGDGDGDCGGDDEDVREKVERLVQWPPSSVLQLARRAVAFGGDPAAVLSELSPRRFPVPDVENSTAEHCYLTKYDYGKRFEDNVINSYIVFLFHAISMLSPMVGFNVSLNRFDLFHGHMFTTYDTHRLGILFHSREYPAYNEKRFPINLGYCQKGSEMPYDESMDLRNILWLAPLATCTEKGVCSDDWLASGVLMILDAKEGGVVYRELVPEYLDDVRTVSEEEFGHLVADINYLNLGISPPENRVFIC